MKLDKKKKVIIGVAAGIAVVVIVLVAFKKQIFGGVSAGKKSGGGSSGGGSSTSDPSYGVPKEDFIRMADAVLDWSKVDVLSKNLLGWDHAKTYAYVQPLRASFSDLTTKYPDWLDKIEAYVYDNNLTMSDTELQNIAKIRG